MDIADVVVVGAGVVGLAVARELARAGRDVIIVEREEAIGTHTSSRNSEVIHAGIYYPTDSLKAWACVRGKELLYDYCESHGVPHRRITKMIAAASQTQALELESIHARADANGVDDLEWLDAAQAAALEPAVGAYAGLLSPSTGIIDSHALMLAYQGDAEDAGAMLALHARVEHVEVTTHGFKLNIDMLGEPFNLMANTLVNAGGLFAPHLAAMIDGLPQETVPRAWFAKGSYFTMTGRAPFSRLIYPIPEPGGLGVHVTLDLGGNARFGPDVEWLDDLDYALNPNKEERFYEAVRAWYPKLPDGCLQPGYTGIRPKISGPGEPAADFVVSGPEQHGIPGLVNMFGIESPGLTASLALAERVTQCLR